MNAPVPATNDHNPQIPFAAACWFWLKLGFISFGGPAGQISIMFQELVERRRWISEKRFLHALNYCMVLPGPEAQQLATYLGWLMHKTVGGLVAGVLFVLPSLFILIGLSWIYMAYGEQPAVAAVLVGIKPAVTVIVMQAAWRIGGKTLTHWVWWCVAVISFLLIQMAKLPFPWIVLGAALIGWWIGKRSPQIIKAATGHGAKKVVSTSSALIDDSTPTPGHARFSRARLITVIVIGLLLAALPFAALVAVVGWQHTYTQMAWFFTKAALLTFGGAYAVLPYVVQGAVEKFAWLSPAQMLDGLALGETTPGPLIMVVAFVAFVGGYGQELLGAQQAFLSGALAAVIVTWFTFLPSFVFIFAGAPLIETTRENFKFTGPLTAITAAVVGVIASLALFFLYHVVWPNGWGSTPHWLSLAIGLVAAALLFWFKRSVIQTILACAAMGLAAHWVM
jgi:chromate transporter